MSIRLTASSAGAIAISVLVGCGGGSSTTSSAEITKAEFINQADAICRESNAAIESEAQRLFGAGAKPSKQDEAAFVTDTLVPSIEEDNDRIRALPLPSGDEEEISEFLYLSDTGAAEAKADPEGFPQSAPSLKGARKGAKAYGLQCGQKE